MQLLYTQPTEEVLQLGKYVCFSLHTIQSSEQRHLTLTSCVPWGSYFTSLCPRVCLPINGWKTMWPLCYSQLKFQNIMKLSFFSFPLIIGNIHPGVSDKLFLALFILCSFFIHSFFHLICIYGTPKHCVNPWSLQLRVRNMLNNHTNT